MTLLSLPLVFVSLPPPGSWGIGGGWPGGGRSECGHRALDSDARSRELAAGSCVGGAPGSCPGVAGGSQLVWRARRLSPTLLLL